MAWSAASARTRIRPVHPFVASAPLPVRACRYRHEICGPIGTAGSPCSPSLQRPSPPYNDSENVENGDGIALTVLAARTTGRIPCHATENGWPGFETPIVWMLFCACQPAPPCAVPAGNPSAGYGGRCVEALRLPGHPHTGFRATHRPPPLSVAASACTQGALP